MNTRPGQRPDAADPATRDQRQRTLTSLPRRAKGRIVAIVVTIIAIRRLIARSLLRTKLTILVVCTYKG